MNVTNNQLFWAKVKPNAVIPTKDDENAGYDIYAYRDTEDTEYVIEPLATKLIPTGIAAAVSKNYYLQVQERGSTGSKGIKYSAGVIDSSYRGEIFIAITNTNLFKLVITPKVTDVDYSIKKHENIAIADTVEAMYYPITKAIAQLIVHDVPSMETKEISYEELKEIPSDRGTGSLGSSRK